jgi:hypothetical protein
MEVKKKFRKDGIELDDARQNISQENISREKYFADASGFSWRRRLAGGLRAVVQKIAGPSCVRTSGTPAPQ